MVAYPREGGFQEIFKAFVPRIPEVELNAEIVHIDPVRRVATSRDGRSFSWDFLVSTLPLPKLCRVVEGTPAGVTSLADGLEYMSLRVALILTKKLDTTIQRIYSADPEVPAHKIAMNHNSSESLKRLPVHAIMAEVSHSPEKPVDLESIAPRTVDFLVQAGVVPSRNAVLWTGHIDVDFAYPVYTHQRPGQVQGVKDWMGQHHIYSVGRFGDWAYVNSDKCVARGLELGRELREKYPVGSSVPA
jgi:protoporphyrinogen oxidase